MSSRLPFVAVTAMALMIGAHASVRAQAELRPGQLVPDPRVMRDSLARTTDRRAVRNIEQQYARSTTAGGAIAAGFAALRSYELSRLIEDTRNARRYFDRARDLDPTSAWPLYGWAVASLPLVKDPDDPGRFRFAGDNAFLTDLGLDMTSRARRALEKAVALDPSHAEAARLLARLAADTRDTDAAAQATTALKKLADTDPLDPSSRIALAAAAVLGGDLETAAAAAKAAAAIATGAEKAAAHHLAARALLRMPGREEEGAAEYFAGLRDLTREHTRTYYDELRGIATPGEVVQLETLPIVRAQSWIQTFWEMHAALSAVTVPHRLASHFRRLPHAEEYFMREQTFGAVGRNALLLQRPVSPFDDRGVIYLRHGEPDDVVRTPNTESWVYMNLGGQPEMYHFTDGASEGIQGINDWYLMYNLPCDPHFHAARALYDKRLSKLIHAQACDPLLVREVSALVRRDIRAALITEVDRIGYVKPLPATYDIYTFRGANGWTDVVAALGVQAAGMKPLSLQNGQQLYSVKTSLIVIDTAARDVSRRDTVMEARAAVIADRGSVLLGNLSLSALPSSTSVHRVAVADAYEPTHGQLYGGPLVVTDYSGNNLMISDVVLAQANIDGPFRRGDVSLALVPWQTFRKGEFRVFYEIYNVSPGHEYTTELKLEAVTGGISGVVKGLLGRRPVVSLRFDDVAPTESLVIQQVREAQADPSAGAYKLTITITDQRTGQKVSRTRPVTVID